MADVVREFFPDAPEQCLDCPGLKTAAERLRFGFEISTSAATRDTNPDNPLAEAEDADERSDMTAAMARFLTHLAQDGLETLPPVAKELYDNCVMGAQEVNVKQGRSKKPQQQMFCGSQSPLANFIPSK